MKLAIGTAQFGMKYGVANTNGQTTPVEAKNILESARKGGLDTLDTAAAYGQSEAILGALGVTDWCVVSKIPPLPDAHHDGEAWVRNNLQQSLTRLQVTQLDGVLLHHAADVLGENGGGVCRGLRAAKEAGWVKKIGYSIYSPDLLPQLVAQLVPDMVQAPLNVLDQRLVTSGWLERLVEKEVEVHVRSIFLQGLLLMKPANRPAYFSAWASCLARWDRMAGELGGAVAACLGYAKSLQHISRVIVGVETAEHLQQLLDVWADAPMGDYRQLCSDDLQLIDPCRWRL